MDNWTKERLNKTGKTIKTVFDIGVAFGTPQLYKAFPDSRIVLCEPLEYYGPAISHILNNYDSEWQKVAIGDSCSKTTFHYNENDAQRASLLERTILTDASKNKSTSHSQEIDIVTLDEIIKKGNFKAPFGLKIDTEGFEDRVIKGATKFLKSTHFVIAEVSLAKRFNKSYSFSDFVALMDENGFELYDVLTAPYVKNSGGVEWNGTVFIDGYFLRKDLVPKIR